MPRRRQNYKKAAARYYRRRNAQARRKVARKWRRKKKVSLKQVHSIAKRVAHKLDKKLPFKNQVQTLIGTYYDDPSIPQMYGRVNYLQQLTLNPYTIKICAFESNSAPSGSWAGRNQLVMPYLQTTEQSGADTLKDRLNRRGSDKIYVTGFSFKGSIKIPQNSSGDLVQICIVECMTGARHQNEVDTETEFNDLMKMDSLPALSGFQKITTQEQPLFRRTNRVVVNKVYKIKNELTQSKFTQVRVKHFFKKPKLVQYMETDTSGLHPLNRFWWLSLRCSGQYDNVSTLPDGGFGVVPTALSPEIIGTFKVFYHDKGL